MPKKKALIEVLSALEHQQWMEWSKTLTRELKLIRSAINADEPYKALTIINDRLESWQSNWKLYDTLDGPAKDADRKWAKKVMNALSLKCPKCGAVTR